MLIIDKKNSRKSQFRNFFFIERKTSTEIKSKTKFNEKTFHISSLRRNATA